MIVEEHAAKRLLADRGITVPTGRTVTSADDATAVALELRGPVVLKAQLPTGGRGKAGLIRFANSASEASAAAAALLGISTDAGIVERLLVETRVSIDRELYAAVTTDPSRRTPLLLFSTEGGVEVEARHAEIPDGTLARRLDVRRPLELTTATDLLRDTSLARSAAQTIAPTLVALWNAYRELDAELVEINPLALTPSGGAVAVDCKLVIDDSAIGRQPDLPSASRVGTPLEQRAKAAGLLYIELDGDVGLLANGAGLTMATMDTIAFYGGRPANFMEIGGDAYKKAAPALDIVLSNPRVRSLLVNLCGAFARTDVMVDGLVAAWAELQPRVPLAMSIHGTGEDVAARMVRERLGVEPYEEMDDAVREAIRLAGKP